MTYRSFLRTALCALTAAALACAQDDETAFNQRQAKAMNAFAKKAFDKGFPRQARLIWLQVIKLYDADNAEAFTGMGYVKVGSSWNPKPNYSYPTADTGTSADGTALYKGYEALKKELANQHRQQAETWAKADRKDRANHHWAMVLRFAEGDEKAKAALEHVEVGSLSGTNLEKTLYDRSKLIERAVEEQSKTDYEVKKVEGVACEPLDKAQVKYVTVQSEHFTLHGDAEEETNLEALRWAERTLRVCRVAFPWQYDPEAKWPNDWAYFVAKETYQQILKANQVADLEWKLEHSTNSGVGNTIVGATSGTQVLFDSMVRNVAQGYAGFGSDGYREGIGHTFVGMVFQNNRLFSVDLKKQEGTSASEEDREYQSPDFDVWKTLNLELAWKSTGAVAARDLPFCDAAAFSNEERIKAWSFCDYVMRRDPTLLRDMDRIALEMKAQRDKQPAEFEKRFDGAHDVTVAQLDREWSDFWTEASPVLKAIQNNTPPLAAVSKGVEKWLEAFNAARKEHDATPVRWSSNLSTRCKEHAEYLKKNKDERGPAREHTQSVALGGSYAGSLFAQMAVVATDANVGAAKKMFQRWLYLPGYRDTLVNNTLLTIGLYTEGDILVMNAVGGVGNPKRSEAGARCFPPANSNPVLFDGAVPVEDLGPEVAALLEKHGRAGQKEIGFPLTLHFGGTGSVSVSRQSMTCAVTAKGQKIEGVLVWPDGNVRRTTAPGMVVFYPLDPLPKGLIEFAWSWDAGGNLQKAKGSLQSR